MMIIPFTQHLYSSTFLFNVIFSICSITIRGFLVLPFCVTLDRAALAICIPLLVVLLKKQIGIPGDADQYGVRVLCHGKS